MQSQSRENNDPHELNNPIPYSVSALILGLTLWAVAYIFWTSNTLQEANEIEHYGQLYNKSPETIAVTTAPVVKTSNAQSTTSPEATKTVKHVNGKAIYLAQCAACHQSTGKGLSGVFPPLDGSVWVTTDNHELPIEIIAKGLTGKITVAGVDYNGVMPAFGHSLSAQELAALVSYIRGAWSNKSSIVSADLVAKSLTKHSEQSASWSGQAQLVERVGTPQ